MSSANESDDSEEDRSIERLDENEPLWLIHLLREFRKLSLFIACIQYFMIYIFIYLFDVQFV